jgi:DNA-binding response OmpR family regulator
MADKTILCVDDSPTVLLSMTNALTEVGYKVITAADGEKALLKALETVPDLVLLDVVLPKRNGSKSAVC